MKQSYGFAVVWNDHILLQHATKARWVGTFSITKGEHNPGETELETAIREFKEETGHSLSEKLIASRHPLPITVQNSSKVLKAWFIKIDKPEDIGISSETLKYPKEDLQDAEIDWCGFVPFDEAEVKMAPYQLDIIKRARELYSAKPKSKYSKTPLGPNFGFSDEALNFLPKYLFEVLANFDLEELKGMKSNIERINKAIAEMPEVYATEGKNKKAWLHYFAPSSDWYIVEKDNEAEGVQHRAYGVANLNSSVAGLGEYGYIPIEELRNIDGVELDLHFTPQYVVRKKNGELDLTLITPTEPKPKPIQEPQTETMQKIMPKNITLTINREKGIFVYSEGTDAYSDADAGMRERLDTYNFDDLEYKIEFEDGYVLEGTIDCQPRSFFDGVSNPFTKHLTTFWNNLANGNYKPSHPFYEGSQKAKALVSKYYLGGNEINQPAVVTPKTVNKEEKAVTAAGGADLSGLMKAETKHIPYVPVSNNCRYNLGTVIPKGMASETYSSLLSLNEKLKQTYGLDLDGYVQERLMFQPEELGLTRREYNALSKEEKDAKINAAMCDLLAPEQVDALALAMFNIESRGQGMIIGDMTGIGKGRIAAALIRYSIMYLKKKPIFITEKGYLFSDIYRDLQDISADPLIPLKIKTGDRMEKVKFSKTKIAEIIKERKENGDSEEEAQEYVENLIENGGVVVKSTYVINKKYEQDVEKLNKKILRIVPFILNDKNEANSVKCMSANPERDAKATWFTAKDGDIIYEALPNSGGLFQSVLKTQRLPKEYNMIMCTYSQVSNFTISKKMALFAELAKNNIVICDESHNASGQSNTGTFIIKTLQEALGACFLSATYAKRPDNMALYASKTCMAEANLDAGAITAAINRGGVPLQEVISSQLVAEGQMVRRERSFAGVDIKYNVMDQTMDAQGLNYKDKHSAISNIFTAILRDIIDIQLNVLRPYLTGKKDNKQFVKDVLAEKMGVDSYDEIDIPKEFNIQRSLTSSPVFSRVFNIINQLLFSLKSEAIAERAIEYLREGKKPVIAFANTMESFLDGLQNSEGNYVSDGEVISTDFRLILEKLLENLQYFTIKKPDGTQERSKMELDELPNEVARRIISLKEKMKTISVGICISPIDVILYKIREAGFSVEEVTGRETRIDFTGDPTFMTGKMLKQAKPIATKVFLAFNQNKVDCVLINQSGAVGASIHTKPNSVVNHVLYEIEPGVRKSMPWNPKTMDASKVCVPNSLEPRNEIKQRKMLSLQAELDINKEVQKRGRIMRSGQLMLPAYEYLSSAIPAEQRLQMMMKKKLESLDANTSADQKKSDNLIDTADFLNKYGDQVVINYLFAHPELNAVLGDPLKMRLSADDPKQLKKPESKDAENAAHRVTGRVAILSVAEQEKFYQEVSENYAAYITDLKEKDEYDAEIEYYDLRAETLERDILIVGSGGQSLFGRNTIMERCEVNNLRKPYTKEDIDTIMKASLLEFEDFNNPALQQQKNNIKKLNDYYQEKKSSLSAKYAEKLQESFEKLEKDKKLARLALKDKAQADNLLKLYKQQATEENEARKEDDLKYMDSRQQYVRNYLSKLKVGQTLNFKSGGFDVPAVVLGIDIPFDGILSNPFAPSNIRLKLAIANGLRVVTISFSNEEAINECIANLETDTDESDRIIEDWDRLTKEATADRVQRYIATGNLLQAMGDPDVYVSSRLIKFTTNTGKIRTGYLMAQEYNPANSSRGQGGRYVMIPVKYCLPILDLLDAPKKSRYITDNNIDFSRAENDIDFVIKVEKGNKSNHITQDATILALLQNEKGFSDFGRIPVYNPDTKKTADVNAMGAVIEEENMQALLDYLSEKYMAKLRTPKSVFDTMKKAISIDFTDEYDDGLNTELDESGLSSIKIDLSDPNYQRILTAQQSNPGATIEVVEEDNKEITDVVVSRPEDMKAPTPPPTPVQPISDERIEFEFEKNMFKLLKLLSSAAPKKESGGELGDKSVKKMFDVFDGFEQYLGSLYFDNSLTVSEAQKIANEQALVKYAEHKGVKANYVGEQGVLFVG